jgi:GT2 family glycosyltransferase
MKISIFAVCHNSYQESFKFLESIDKSLKNNEIDLDLFFIDNSTLESNKDINSIKKLQFNYKIHYFRSDNLGYFPSIASVIIKNNILVDNYDYTCISNVDLRLSKSFFQNMLNIQKQNKVGVYAPSIISLELNVNKNPKISKRPSRLKLQVNKLFFKFFLSHILLKFVNSLRLTLKESISRKKNSLVEKNFLKEIYAAHGSFLIFTKTYIQNENSFSYPIFLFGEEIYVAEIAKKHGLKIMYCPSLIIYDDEHASTSLISSKGYRKFNREALTYLLSKYDF